MTFLSVRDKINTGLAETPQGFQFGVEQKVPEFGFPVCRDCGVVADSDAGMGEVEHRKSCAGRKRTEKAYREGRGESGYRWERVYLYRELKSEAIRLLLSPNVESEDIETLRACLFLGLRLHFRGSPGHLLIEPQILPDHKQGIRRHYLVIMDAVPGGTGFLKSLFEPKHAGEIPGEGIMTVLRLALDALQSCSCRLIGPEEDDTDGCYRCIRAYRLQHQSDEISRERGIRLLTTMIAAGEQRVVIQALDDLDASSLFGSVLEKKFIERLEAVVTDSGGEWQKTLVKGASGFRFRLGPESRFWEIQPQPRLAQGEGVMTACQPDFVPTSDDAAVLPIAVFTDGFEFHVNPGKPTSRLARRCGEAPSRARQRQVLGVEHHLAGSAGRTGSPAEAATSQNSAGPRAKDAGYRENWAELSPGCPGGRGWFRSAHGLSAISRSGRLAASRQRGGPYSAAGSCQQRS